MTNQEKLLDVAKGELGTQEGVNNKNKYTDWAAGVPCTQWCAGFVSWCFAKADLREAFMNGKKTIRCSEIYDWATKNGRVLTDKTAGAPGDVILFDWENDGKPNHVGLVEAAKKSSYTTIEGNWNDKVSRVNRPFGKNVFAVIRPAWPAANAPQKPQVARVIYKGLMNVREGAGTNFRVLDTIKTGTSWQILRTKQAENGGLWGEISPGRWLCIVGADGVRYCEATG